MARKVDVVPYDPGWPVVYAAEAESIRLVLGTNVIAVHHIGSTAIPGMAAKPTIDLLVIDQDHDRLDACNGAMRAAGYHAKGENGVPGRRYFQRLIGDVHLFHIHAYEKGHPDIDRHLKFRDYLRAHPVDARAYEALKHHLAAQFPFEPQKYTSGKTSFILAIDQRAAGWCAGEREPETGI